jgi:hypothetical protein
LPIFGKKIGVFLKHQCHDPILHNLALFWAKNANFFAKFFSENILKIITSVPGHPGGELIPKQEIIAAWSSGLPSLRQRWLEIWVVW